MTATATTTAKGVATCTATATSFGMATCKGILTGISLYYSYDQTTITVLFMSEKKKTPVNKGPSKWRKEHEVACILLRTCAKQTVCWDEPRLWLGVVWR